MAEGCKASRRLSETDGVARIRLPARMVTALVMEAVGRGTARVYGSIILQVEGCEKGRRYITHIGRACIYCKHFPGFGTPGKASRFQVQPSPSTGNGSGNPGVSRASQCAIHHFTSAERTIGVHTRTHTHTLSLSLARSL